MDGLANPRECKRAESEEDTTDGHERHHREPSRQWEAKPLHMINRFRSVQSSRAELRLERRRKAS